MTDAEPVPTPPRTPAARTARRSSIRSSISKVLSAGDQGLLEDGTSTPSGSFRDRRRSTVVTPSDGSAGLEPAGDGTSFRRRSTLGGPDSFRRRSIKDATSQKSKWLSTIAAVIEERDRLLAEAEKQGAGAMAELIKFLEKADPANQIDTLDWVASMCREKPEIKRQIKKDEEQHLKHKGTEILKESCPKKRWKRMNAIMNRNNKSASFKAFWFYWG